MYNLLSDIVGKRNIIKGGGDSAYEAGYRYGSGSALCIVKPENTKQVCDILRVCSQNQVAVIAQGGNSNLVASAIADDSSSQVILNTSNLNKDILEVNESSKTARVGAGIILDSLNEYLFDKGLCLPIDFGASGTANIGGMVSTNTAGTRAGRYGNMKSRTKEVTVALANGDVKVVTVKNKSLGAGQILQDNAHLDVQNPFIGSSGWLGIVVEAKIYLDSLNKQSNSIVVVPDSIKSINKIRKLFEEKFGDQFTAFEVISDYALKLVAQNNIDTKYLFDSVSEKTDEHKYALLLEVSSKDEAEELNGKLEEVVFSMLEDGLIVTGLMGKDDLYWHHRHHITDSIAKEAKNIGFNLFSTDVAVRNIDDLQDFLIFTENTVLDKFPETKITAFGHGMLGSVHFNGMTKCEPRKIQELVYDIVVRKYNGTFSAEHGIGAYNQWAYDKYISSDIKKAAKDLKKLYDPQNILNPNINFASF